MLNFRQIYATIVTTWRTLDMLQETSECFEKLAVVSTGGGMHIETPRNIMPRMCTTGTNAPHKDANGWTRLQCKSDSHDVSTRLLSKDILKKDAHCGQMHPFVQIVRKEDVAVVQPEQKRSLFEANMAINSEAQAARPRPDHLLRLDPQGGQQQTQGPLSLLDIRSDRSETTNMIIIQATWVINTNRAQLDIKGKFRI